MSPAVPLHVAHGAARARLPRWLPVLELPAAGHPVRVRRYRVEQRTSQPFVATVVVGTTTPDIRVAELVGTSARLSLTPLASDQDARVWDGICAAAACLHALPEGEGESRFRLTLVPRLWRLGLGRGHRLHQHQSVVDTVHAILDEHHIDHTWRLSRSYPRRALRVQYGQSDLTFVSLLLQEAGIAYAFDGARVVLSDHLEAGALQSGLPYVAEPLDEVHHHVTAVSEEHACHVDGVTVRDVDFLRPDYALSSTSGTRGYEQHHYAPDVSLVAADADGSTPAADDTGAYRHRDAITEEHARVRLEAIRIGAASVRFRATDPSLSPGDVVRIEGYPAAHLDRRRLLIDAVAIAGEHDAAPTLEVHARAADRPYRPPHDIGKPRIHGVQSATVVGPDGEEVHTDEHGRVRVRFPWDRRGDRGHDTSPWLRVSYPTAGAAYGQLLIPHVGEEVLVAFVDGDPDCPVVVGRVYNARCPVPYKLPEQKLVSGWRRIPRTPPATPHGATQDATPKANEHAPRVGANELGSDDSPHGQRLFLRAVDDMSLDVNRVRRSWIGADDHIAVDGDRSLRVNGTHQRRIGEHERVEVGRGYRLEMADGPTTYVEMRSDSIRLATSGATVTLRGDDVDVSAGGAMNVKAGGDMSVCAGGTLTLRGALIELNPPTPER